VSEATCACGAPVFIKRSGECKSCYHRRYNSERREAALALTCSDCGRRAVAVVSTMLCTDCTLRRRRTRRSAEVTYHAALLRVHADRGSASSWRCIRCGRPAEKWAYRAGSPREIAGVVEADGKRKRMRWSPDPADYEPRCGACDAAIEGRPWRVGARHRLGGQRAGGAARRDQSGAT